MDTKKRREPDADLDAIAHGVIGAAITVHRALGPGLRESVYRRAMVIELRRRGHEVAVHSRFDVHYESELVGTGQTDLLVDRRLVVELKAVKKLIPRDKEQLIYYLKAGHYQLGLLLNFNVKLMKEGIQRVVNMGEAH